MESKIKNKKIKNCICFLAGMMVMWAVSCVVPEEWGPKYDENIVPGPVSNVQVENLNGGAIISFALPSNVDKKDLLGAKVVYSLTTDGELMERWSYAEDHSIELEGYGDMSERTVTVYAVHKNGNISVGVPTTIKPLTPPIFIIRETLQTKSTFGGVQVIWDNPLRKNMGISLYAEDSITHEMVLYDKYFSNSINGKTSFRPFDAKEQNFRIEMFDRWQNYAQVLDTTLTPLYEIEILPHDALGNNIWSLFDDGRVSDALSPWRNFYRCDAHNNRTTGDTRNRPFEKCFYWSISGFDDAWEPGRDCTYADYLPGGDAREISFPLYVTFDMGRKAVYSRLKFLPVIISAFPFSYRTIVEFDVWGTNNAKLVEDVEDPHGIYPKGSREANQAYWSSWKEVYGTDAWKNDWVKIGVYKYLLSSGDNLSYSGIQLSDEDLYKWTNGYDFDFDLEVTEAFRYLRWEIHNTNTRAPHFGMAGLRYWGSYANED